MSRIRSIWDNLSEKNPDAIKILAEFRENFKVERKNDQEIRMVPLNATLARFAWVEISARDQGVDIMGAFVDDIPKWRRVLYDGELARIIGEKRIEESSNSHFGNMCTIIIKRLEFMS